MTVVVVTYSFAGGLIATAATNTVQGGLEVVMSLLLVPFGLYAVGGFAGLHASLDGYMFSLTAGGLQVLTVDVGAGHRPHRADRPGRAAGTMALLGSGRTEMEGADRLHVRHGHQAVLRDGLGLTGLIVAAMVAQGKIDPAELDGHRERAFGIAIRDLLPAGMVGLMAA